MKTKLSIIIFSLISLIGYAQSSASISDELVISIEDPNMKIPEYVLIDISNLDFQSQEKLDLFCKAFSYDYQRITGNFSNQELKIQFDRESLYTRGIDLAQVNANFLNVSKRMLYVYSYF